MERRNFILIILYAVLGIALVVGVIYLLRNREEILSGRLPVAAPGPAATKTDVNLPEGTRSLDSYESEAPFKAGDNTPYIPSSRLLNPSPNTQSPQSP